MSRNTFCTLSTANLLHNLAVIKAKTPNAKIMAMVKANAYGHGLRSVAQRLEGCVDALGVASIDEALALRQSGIKTPITLIEGVFTPEELPVAAAQGFSVVFHSEHQLSWLAQAALPAASLTAWLKVNTGLGRLGFPVTAALQALAALSAHASIGQPVGLLSHFACADEPNHALNRQQSDAFRLLASHFQGPKSLCNSAGIFAFPDLHYDWVRPGLALYGASPLSGCAAAALDLKPVMTFHTELIAIQKLKQGECVGYGARFTCPEDMPVGIMAVGYGDGYPRTLQQGTPVLINGVRCPLIGRVAMDISAVDLRPCVSAAAGDRVTLWGEALAVEDVAAANEHVDYDLLTGVQNRVKFAWLPD